MAESSVGPPERRAKYPVWHPISSSKPWLPNGRGSCQSLKVLFHTYIRRVVDDRLTAALVASGVKSTPSFFKCSLKVEDAASKSNACLRESKRATARAKT